MALPKLNSTPNFELTVPSTKKKVKFRPFLVQEEKDLLLAQETEDQNVIINTIKSIISSCTLNQVDTSALAFFDIEYIMLQIRAKSVGEVVDLVFPCDVCQNDEKAVARVSIDISTIGIETPPGHDKNIKLVDDIGMVMKYPSVDILTQLTEVKSDTEYYDIVSQCIDFVYQGDTIHSAKEQTKEELSNFINSLTQKQFEDVKNFFATQPKLKQKVSYTCPVCGLEHNKTIEGLKSFFQ